MGESEEVRREREGRRGRDRQEVVQCISHPRPSFQYRFLVHVGFFVRDTGVLHPREHKGGQQPIKGVPLDNSKARPSRLRPRVKNLYATSGGAGEKEAKGLSLSKHSFPAGRCYPTQFIRGKKDAFPLNTIERFATIVFFKYFCTSTSTSDSTPLLCCS